MDTNELSLDEARDIIDKAGNNINLAVSNLEDQEYSDVEDYHDVSRSVDESLAVSESEKSVINEPLSEKSEEILTNSVTEDVISERREDDSTNQEIETSRDEEEDENKIDIMAALKELEAEEDQPRLDVNTLPLLPPRPAPTPELAQRKSWHPVMLDTSPPPVIEEKTGNEEAPHKKLMRDLKQAIGQQKIKASPERKKSKKKRPVIEVIRTTDNGNTAEKEPELSVEAQLRTMQQQLKALTRLPATIQATLSAVTAKIDGLLPVEQANTPDTLVDSETSNANNEFSTEESIGVLDERTDSTDIQSEEEVLSLSQSVHESEMETEPAEPTADQIEKQERLAKLETLNKGWLAAWAGGSKPVYKIAEHYKVPYSDLISSRVKTLEHKVPLKRL